MRDLERRLAQLERKEEERPHLGQLVVYDMETGLPLQPIDKRASMRVWIPDNGRDQCVSN